MLRENKEIFDLCGITKYHEAGILGQGKHIVVLDRVADKNGHDLKVAGVTKEVLPLADIEIRDRRRENIKESIDYIFANEETIDAVVCSFSMLPNEEIERVRKLKIPVVCAAGNESNDKIIRPAAYPETIAVGAWYPELDRLAEYSNRGAELDCVAPTGTFVSINGNIAPFGGTSASTPLVAGMLCLANIKTWREAKEFIKNNCIDKYEPGHDWRSGWGLFVLPELEVLNMLPITPGRISQEYGRKNTAYRKGYHTGIDFVAAEADKYIYSVGAGTVLVARYVSGSRGADPDGWGNYVIIRQPDGYDVIYAHLSRVRVSTGQVIFEGSVLGLQGSTGNSTGPHLHFEVRKQPWSQCNDTDAAEYLGIVNTAGAITKKTKQEAAMAESLKGEIVDADATVVYKGQKIPAGIITKSEGGRTYIELSTILKALGKPYTYDNQTKTVTIF